MIKVYLQGVNIIVDDGVNKEYIPTRVSRMESNPNDDFIVVSDYETKYARSISFDEITDKDGVTFATKQEAEDYLTEFVGSFKKGGGGVTDAVTKDELTVVGTELDYNTLLANRNPSEYLGKYIVVQEGANGLVVFGRRFNGNDAGLYFSDGVSWTRRTDIDGSDIIIDTTNLSYSSSLQLRNVLEDLDVTIQRIDSEVQNVEILGKVFISNISQTLYQDDEFGVTISWDAAVRQLTYTLDFSVYNWSWHDASILKIDGNSSTIRENATDISASAGTFYFTGASRNSQFDMENYGSFV